MTYKKFLVENASDDELVELQSNIDKRLFHNEEETEAKSELELIGAYKEEASELIKSWGKFHGASTGLAGADRLTYGMTPGELVIMGGVPAVGKSMLMLQMAGDLAQSNLVAYMSLELTHAQVYARLAQMVDDVDSLNLVVQKHQFIEHKEFKQAAKKAAEGGAKFLFVDYLQMLGTSTDREHAEIARIIRDLKMIALELNIIVIAISALNRDRGKDDRLKISDLYGSSKIEYYADHIWFLEWGESSFSSEPQRIFTVAKNRSNPWNPQDNECVVNYNGKRFST